MVPNIENSKPVGPLTVYKFYFKKSFFFQSYYASSNWFKRFFFQTGVGLLDKIFALPIEVWKLKAAWPDWQLV